MPVTSDVPRAYVPMDPRIRRRRVEVRRRQGRRRLRIVLAFVGLLTLTGMVWLALHSPLLDVDAISIAGGERTNPAAIWRASGIRSGAPMIDVDVAAAARAVEALPWVAEAVVRRQWPDEVSIIVTERTAVAAFRPQTGAPWALVDRSGRVLDQVSDLPAGMVAVEGVTAAAAPGTVVPDGQDALAVATSLSGELAARVAAVRVLAGGELELQLHAGGVVRLGAAADLQTKLSAAETMLASVDSRDLAVLDVRLPSSPVLTRA